MLLEGSFLSGRLGYSRPVRLRAVASGVLTVVLLAGCRASVVIDPDDLDLVAVAAADESALAERYVFDVLFALAEEPEGLIELSLPLPACKGGQRVNLLVWEVDSSSQVEVLDSAQGRTLRVTSPGGGVRLRLRVELELPDGSVPLTPGALDVREWSRVAGGDPVAKAAGVPISVEPIGTLAVRRSPQN